MFDVARIGALLAQRKPGHSLSRALYNSPEVFEFDLEAIFGEAWILAGFSCELPEPRSTLALVVGRSPIVLTRDRHGTVRGFHNSCRHRGAQVCPTGKGRRSRLTCPYHQWVYDLDGRLVQTADMQVSFDRASHGLNPIHVQEVAGALFVSLAQSPPDFESFRRELEPLLKVHNLANAKVACETTLTERGNWKLVMENARECYHCPTSHRELSRTFPVHNTGGQYRVEGDPRHESFVARLEALGIGLGPHTGPWWQVERLSLNAGQASLTIDGKPAVKRAMVDGDDLDLGSLRWAIDPHMFCHSTADTTVTFSAMPTGPNETVVTCKWLVHKDAVEGVDYEIDHLTKLWTITNLEDRDLVENNQRGVNALGYVPGPYCEAREAYLMRFVDWYCAAATAYVARHTEAGEAGAMSQHSGPTATPHPAFYTSVEERVSTLEPDHP